MASRDIYYDSLSDEDIPEPTESFRSADLPIISNPTPYSDESSSSVSVDTDSLSCPSTPTTPASPATSLGAVFSHVGLSTQTSDDQVFSTPKPKRKRLVKRKVYPFKKGHTINLKRSSLTPGTESVKFVRPTSSLYKDMHFARETNVVNIKLSADGLDYSKNLSPATSNQIVNLAILNQVFALLSCVYKTCKGKMRLYERLLEDGLQKFLLIKCDYCHNVVAEFPASLPIGVPADKCINNKSLRLRGQSDVNLRSLLAVHTTSQSWEDFRLMCSILDLKVPASEMSKRHLNNFVDTTTRVVSKSMELSANQVHSSSRATDLLPENLRSCTVSFDASWHRRGHFSNQGFAAAIDSEHGKVLDYQLYDRVCYPCSKWPEERKENNPEDYEEYWSTHNPLCTANFSGSSQSMESAAAVEIWKRSVSRHRLVYDTYIGDGDSSSYKNLVKSDPYNGLTTVRKEECLGHVQKRIKKHLHKKSETFKGLPEAKADWIAHLYALVIVQHRGESPLEIHEALQVLLLHTDEKHASCPEGSTSWCYYRKLVSKHLEDSSSPLPVTRAPFLTVAEFNRTTEVFQVFASLSFCKTITLGKTQNSNESLHNMLWHNAPKAKRVGHKSLVASTALAVLSFNEGSLSYSVLMKELGLTASHQTIQYFCRRDRRRNQARVRRVMETHKRRRRQIVTQTRIAESSRKRQDKAVYSSGKFGSEVQSSGEESDTLCCGCNLRDCPIRTTRVYDRWVCCHHCQDWYHSNCVGIRNNRKLPEYYFCNNCQT